MSGTSLDLGSAEDEPRRDFTTDARAVVAAAMEAAKQKAREQPTICITGDCQEPRLPTRHHCRKHQDLMDAHSTPEQVAERERRDALAHSLQSRPAATGAGQIVCPHCQVRGHVRTRSVKNKRGVSGGKATGALMTGGLSLFVTGLSRKERATECHCGNCGMTWSV